MRSLYRWAVLSVQLATIVGLLSITTVFLLDIRRIHSRREANTHFLRYGPEPVRCLDSGVLRKDIMRFSPIPPDSIATHHRKTYAYFPRYKTRLSDCDSVPTKVRRYQPK